MAQLLGSQNDMATIRLGANDGLDEMDEIVRLLKGKYAMMNLIPFNTVAELDYQRPSWEKAAELARYLHRRGVLAKLRNSAGQDVDGGCGQLRARVLATGEAASKPLRRIQSQ